jgi:predicted ester cyclase
MAIEDPRAFYAAYIGACNEHRFGDLTPFVASDIVVDDETIGQARYIALLNELGAAFADYHWEIRRLVVEDPWLAVHLAVTGTHTGPWLGVAPTGRRIRAHEHAIYRIHRGMIAEVRSITDNLLVRQQLER